MKSDSLNLVEHVIYCIGKHVFSLVCESSIRSVYVLVTYN
jgi:hypothetical protein